jgi:hypothetical protein
MPTGEDETCYYRLVLEHGDFGIHNMTISMNARERPLVTSVYDWETGCIVPALLSEPLMAVTVDLVPDEDATPSVTRVPDEADGEDRREYMEWAECYFKVRHRFSVDGLRDMLTVSPPQILFKEAPDYRRTIQAGRDARYLWSMLKEWRGEDPEAYFGALGQWAERRIVELRVD